MKKSEIEKIQKIELTLWNDLADAENKYGIDNDYTVSVRNHWAGAYTIINALGVKTLWH